MTLAEQLSGWSTGLSLADVPEAARRAAVRHLLDGFGTALAARQAGVVDAAVTVARTLGGPPVATILGGPDRVSAPAAALANGALVHGLDFDDTHARGLVHATAAVLPTVFAVGEEIGASGADVLTAAVAGYETVCRIAMASPHGFHARGLHATSIAGVFASSIVTAKLLDLSAAITAQGLGIAGSSAGGLLEFMATGAATKRLHPGLAGLNGQLAARLAAAGATGPVSVLEGEHGIYAALSARPADLGVVTRGLGEQWEVTEITIKPYPCCQLIHVSLDAVAEALAGRTVRPDEVAEVIAYVHPDSASVVCEPAASKLAPTSDYDAKFSLPWSVAARLVDGGLAESTYAPSSLTRPDVRTLAARVRTVLSPTAGVAADAPGQVEIRLVGGKVLSGGVPRSKGGPQAPLSDDEVLAKFLRNAGEGPAARELADRVLDLAEQRDVSAIVTAARHVVGG